MTYTIIREAPVPTEEQLGRPSWCCPDCESPQPVQTKLLPRMHTALPGMEKLADLEVGDALDAPRKYRVLLGKFSMSYDYLNKTKHEYYMITPETVRVRRMK